MNTINPRQLLLKYVREAQKATMANGTAASRNQSTDPARFRWWSNAATSKKSSGDFEDFAISKRQPLREDLSGQKNSSPFIILPKITVREPSEAELIDLANRYPVLEEFFEAKVLLMVATLSTPILSQFPSSLRKQIAESVMNDYKARVSGKPLSEIIRQKAVTAYIAWSLPVIIHENPQAADTTTERKHLDNFGRMGPAKMSGNVIDEILDRPYGPAILTSPTDHELWNAAIDNKYDRVKELLAQGANPNAVDVSGTTVLMLAAEQGNYEIVKLLIAGGAEINRSNQNGQTALMFACIWGFPDIAEHLIDHNAGLNARNIQGNTPLIEAAINGNLSMVALLVQKGAALNIRNNKGLTALSVAEQSHQYSVAKFLRSSGAIS